MSDKIQTQRMTLATSAARLVGAAIDRTASGRVVHPLRGVKELGTRQSKITVEISGVFYAVTVTQLDETEI